MRYTRVYADPAGESHFAEADAQFRLLEFAPPAPPVFVSAPSVAAGWILLRAPAGWFGDWHPTPRRQLFVLIGGEVEVEVSDGERRRLATGDLCLVEDTAGRGHTTRVLGNREAAFVVVQLPD